MDSLRGMQIMVRAIELGSLSAAARELGVTQPTVSKTIAALERQLSVRLIERTTTRFTPTEGGLRFYERAKHILEEFAEACADAQGANARMAGLLRVNAPLGLGEMHLHRIAHGFTRLHPEVEVELILNDRFVDLVEEGVDLAIRLGGAPPASAVARDLATAERFLVASADYLTHHAAIQDIDDLQVHEFVRFAWLESGAMVELFGPDGPRRIALKGRYSINSALSIRQAVCDGMGLAMTPAWLVQDLLDQGQLVRVLPDWSAAGQTLRLVYPSRRYQPQRVRAFMGYLEGEIATVPGLTAARPPPRGAQR
ncbi:MAG: LysR family transcriptional regulator [Acidovorax sp.]|nr:MAG: LysR family transcriptional regulator [Acidovorax sp.]